MSSDPSAPEPTPTSQKSSVGSEKIGLVDEEGRLLDIFARLEPTPTWTLADPSADPSSLAPKPGSWVRAVVQGSRARPVELLADPGTARASLYEVLARSAPPPVYSAAVMAETARLEADPGIDDPSLEDLGALPFVTIDEPTSKDLDQAIHVERSGDGYRLRYAIADAAHFVRPGTALFEQAVERGSTYYLPGVVVPMLPRELSEGLISLNPDVDRRALVFDVHLAHDGEVSSCEIRRCRIHSRLKTSYRDVQAFYDGRPLAGSDGLPADTRRAIEDSLEALAELGRQRLALAEARDVVQVRRRELRVSLSDGQASDGQASGGQASGGQASGGPPPKPKQDEAYGFIAMADPRNDAERYNEQISLLCNVAGARLLASGLSSLGTGMATGKEESDDDAQPIFRFHRAPDDYRLRRLDGRLRALARRHRLPKDPWVWRRGEQSLADYLRQLPDEGSKSSIARAIHRQALLAGGRSGFDSAPGLHYGIGAEAYARYTAPMREVVGIFVHKETWEQLGQTPANDPEDDERLRTAVVEAANRSRALQRKLDDEVNRLVLDQICQEDLQSGRVRAGVILGISRSKVHVQLEDPPVDVKIYHQHLEKSLGLKLMQGRDGITLRRADNSRTRWVLGDRVGVRVLGHDREADRWRLDLVRASS